ncbi:efflux RND transporter periplasmic adaptor subunit [Sulfitobacter sp. JB4-11]|uniref:efflux RND transporter periplasmic adaptor subunit n=1 Tax=Sulfitobacter rhodophyticola TaxID=3238304 RepID=UPI003D81A5A3
MAYSARTVILTGLGIATVAGLAFVSFRTDPVPVDLAEVAQGALEVTINAEGQTQVKDLYEVSSPILGTALRSPVDVGDPVVAGETVVAIVQPVSSGLLDARTRLQGEAALQEALAARHVTQADLQQAEETLSFAQSQFDRTQALVTRGVVSVTRLEDDSRRLSLAKAALEAAQARIEMAEGSIERARASLLQSVDTEVANGSCCIELTAPADGVVLSITAISERPVTVGAPLVSIGDPNDLELVADILSSDAVRLLPGALAYVERWGGADDLVARLDRIDPKARTKVSALGIEEQRVDAYFQLETPSEQRPGLGDEFAVFLRIVEWRADNVLQVPLSAIFRSGEDWAVFSVDQDRAVLRQIELGRRNDRMTEIRSGLEAGERVVMHPNDAIADGTVIVERGQL